MIQYKSLWLEVDTCMYFEAISLILILESIGPFRSYKNDKMLLKALPEKEKKIFVKSMCIAFALCIID